MLRTLSIALALAASTPALPQAALSPEQAAAIKALVIETLKSQPEIIAEALQELQRRNEAAEQAQKTQSIVSSKAGLLETHGLVAGNPKGTATMVEFFDYNCSACRQGFTEIVKAIEADKDLRVIFKELPIIDRENSPKVARLSVAAGMQNKYYEFHKAVMGATGRATEAKALEAASTAGLDIERLKTDAASEATTRILADTDALANTLKLEGTPAIVVGDQFFAGAIDAETIAAAADITRKNGCAIC